MRLLYSSGLGCQFLSTLTRVANKGLKMQYWQVGCQIYFAINCVSDVIVFKGVKNGAE